MRVCPHCGKLIEEDDIYCVWCDEFISSNENL
jgi:RNA polymerase subunit RPABC4/transcription elongation factor Spt4